MKFSKYSELTWGLVTTENYQQHAWQRQLDNLGVGRYTEKTWSLMNTIA
jgi:hypothetical protein